MRHVLAIAVVSTLLAGAGIAGAQGNPGVIHVCAQNWGGIETKGDLNVREGSCKGPRNITLQLGPVKLTQGPPGPQGPAGATGATGPKGETGATGSKGDKGADGNKGETGARGPQGATGPRGPQGPEGPQGPSGAMNCPAGSSLQQITVNSPGGQKRILACVVG
jgi:hypothetical protein